MSPKKITTRKADRSVARGRRDVAAKYLEVAELVATEDGNPVPGAPAFGRARLQRHG